MLLTEAKYEIVKAKVGWAIHDGAFMAGLFFYLVVLHSGSTQPHDGMPAEISSVAPCAIGALHPDTIFDDGYRRVACRTPYAIIRSDSLRSDPI